MEITTYLRNQIHDALTRLGVEFKPDDIELEIPREAAHGDFSTNTAMKLTKILRQNPRKIAENVVAHFQDAEQFVSRTEIAGPGFINFFIDPKYFRDTLKDILVQQKEYGKSTRSRPEKILVEFVSANPTGPMNIVSARSGVVGDTLVRLLNWSGHEAKSEYYVNNTGNQVNHLALSVDLRYRELLGESVEIPDEAYHGDYIIKLVQEIIDEYGPDYFLKDDEERLEFFKQKALEKMIARQKHDLAEYRVEFDRWFYESEILESGKIRMVIDRLLGMGMVYDFDGCLWFKSTEYGDDEDRVLLKSDSSPTYFLPDIGYHMNKYERGFSRLIDIWGPDHHGYIPRMQAALEAVGNPRDSFEVLIVQQVNLLKDGVTLKMSKRAGMIVTMRELLDEVGVDVARYFFLKRRTNSHLDFDLDLAKKESDENPVYYVQYAHARICSILRFAEQEGMRLAAPETVDFALLKKNEELELLKALSRFPDTVVGAADNREPHRIPIYLEAVAALYHQFYHNHRVVTDDKALSQARLQLCQATRIVLANGLFLLGVSAPEQM